MDSRDKQVSDLQDEISKLNSFIVEKNKQIEHLKNLCSDYEKKQTGADAMREALAGEQSLVALLNKQIESYKGRVQTLAQLNDDLTALNLQLQRNGLPKPGKQTLPAGINETLSNLPDDVGSQIDPSSH